MCPNEAVYVWLVFLTCTKLEIICFRFTAELLDYKYPYFLRTALARAQEDTSIIACKHYIIWKANEKKAQLITDRKKLLCAAYWSRTIRMCSIWWTIKMMQYAMQVSFQRSLFANDLSPFVYSQSLPQFMSQSICFKAYLRSHGLAILTSQLNYLDQQRNEFNN